MTPSITAVRLTGSAHRAELPLLVLGPSLDTSAMTTWSACAAGLTEEFDVVAWDLPGQGHNRSVPEEPFTMAELASGVLAVIDDILVQREDAGGRFYYAGDSVGGVVGLQLLLDAPGRVASAVLLGTGAKIGERATWLERISQRTLDEGDAQVCRALADFDVRDRLAEIGVPVLAVAGAADVVSPTASLREIADGVARGRLVELAGVAQRAPAESPGEVARLLRQHFLGDLDPDRTSPDSTVSAEFARDLAMTVRDAIANGVSAEEVKRLLLETAAQCDRPST